MTATEERPVQILELFGGIGSPRCALRNLKIPTKAIDYVEIDEKAVRSYNNMFSEELLYKTQSVVGWNLKPDILIHGSPCQDFSIAGHQRGADEGSETRSSLMWETIHIIDQMGEWKPKYVIWENVKNVTSKHMIANFVRYQKEMERMGYTNNYDVLDAREFGLPQARERVFTISCLNGEKFDFTSLIRTPMRKISEFLEDNKNVPEVYNVTQPSVYNVIGASGIKRATVIKDFAYTITTRQDRTPAQVIDCGSGRYRYLTERECWRLMGYTDEEFEAGGELPTIIQVYTYIVCEQNDVDYEMVFALIEQESRCRWDAEGDNGTSIGLMQVSEKWHMQRMEELGAYDLKNPYQNVLVGVNYLSEIQNDLRGTVPDEDLPYYTLAVYNYGKQGAKANLWDQGVVKYTYNTKIMDRAQQLKEEKKKVEEGRG